MNCHCCERPNTTNQYVDSRNSLLLSPSVATYIVELNYRGQDKKHTFLCSHHLVIKIKKKEFLWYQVENLQGYKFKPCIECLYPMLLCSNTVTEKRCFRC